MSKQKLLLGLAAYAALALLAWFTLEKEILWATWVVLAGLAAKTLIASEQLRAQHAAQTGESSGDHEVDPHKEQHEHR